MIRAEFNDDVPKDESLLTFLPSIIQLEEQHECFVKFFTVDDLIQGCWVLLQTDDG